MQPEHFDGVITLQKEAFPPPFDEDLLWQKGHLESHLDKFPQGQFVAINNGIVVGSCSNTIIEEDTYQKHLSWEETVGGYSLETFSRIGSTLYGLDISVHPNSRGLGIGRKFYEIRKGLVPLKGLTRYATACRLPDFLASHSPSLREYIEDVRLGTRTDRTLTPLLRYGLTVVDVLENYMQDVESGNGAALLEWYP